MRKIELAAQAIRDLKSIESYWVSRDPMLYRSLTMALEEALDFLVDTPLAGSLVERSRSRKWHIGRTPFLLFYTLKPKVILVARIRHKSENWRRFN